jgi:hypothetical protein
MRIVRKPLGIRLFAAAIVATSAPPLAHVAIAAGEREPQTEAAKKPPELDQRAIAALCRMGAFLRDQRSFTIRTETETDYVTDTGQKLRSSAQGELQVRRPDHLYAHVVSERKDRQFFYDGQTFTMYSPKLGYYTTLEAPPTLLALADELQVRYGLGLPLVDLFRWGSNEADFSDIEEAMYVGPAKIDGVDTDQYAFRQNGVDWQIWIQRGATPLPRKLVLTTTDDPARPEHEIQMAWQLNVQHPDATFAFVPPRGSSQIAIEDLGAPQPEIPETRRATRSPRQQRGANP